MFFHVKRRLTIPLLETDSLHREPFTVLLRALDLTSTAFCTRHLPQRPRVRPLVQRATVRLSTAWPRRRCSVRISATAVTRVRTRARREPRPTPPARGARPAQPCPRKGCRHRGSSSGHRRGAGALRLRREPRFPPSSLSPWPQGRPRSQSLTPRQHRPALAPLLGRDPRPHPPGPEFQGRPG